YERHRSRPRRCTARRGAAWRTHHRPQPRGRRRTVPPRTASTDRQGLMAKILIVEDEEGIREFLADALQDDGHDTVTAEDGLGGLRQLHERAFDLLITD